MTAPTPTARPWPAWKARDSRSWPGCPPPTAATAATRKDDFAIDLEAGTVTCPAGQVAADPLGRRRRRLAGFGLGVCQLARWPSDAPRTPPGADFTIHPHEQILQDHKADQQTVEWQQAYTGTRPKVERKIGHFVARSGVAARPAPGASTESPPTPTPGPRRSTGAAWMCSACTGTVPPGPPPDPDRGTASPCRSVPPLLPVAPKPLKTKGKRGNRKARSHREDENPNNHRTYTSISRRPTPHPPHDRQTGRPATQLRQDSPRVQSRCHPRYASWGSGR